MADMFPVAGMKFFIGGAATVPTNGVVNEASFSGETWVEVDGWAQVGGFGDAATVITQPLVNRSRDVKVKGTRNAGSLENQFAWLPGDAGQAAMIAAEGAASNYAFKIEGPDTGGTTPTIWYFMGLVMSERKSGGGPNATLILEAPIEVNTNMVEVAAT